MYPRHCDHGHGHDLHHDRHRDLRLHFHELDFVEPDLVHSMAKPRTIVIQAVRDQRKRTYLTTGLCWSIRVYGHSPERHGNRRISCIGNARRRRRTASASAILVAWVLGVYATSFTSFSFTIDNCLTGKYIIANKPRQKPGMIGGFSHTVNALLSNKRTDLVEDFHIRIVDTSVDSSSYHRLLGLRDYDWRSFPVTRSV